MKINKLHHGLKVKKATIDDYPTIQNLARFYVYDLSRECGYISNDWVIPSNGLYESFDFRHYFEEPSREAYLIKVHDEIAGFILINKAGCQPETNWNIGEFFILAKFQNKGIGQLAANYIWKHHQGRWEVSVIPENNSALSFWRKAITTFTNGQFTAEIKEVDFDPDQPMRYIFCFESASSNQITSTSSKNASCKIEIVEDVDDITKERMKEDLVAYEANHGIDVNYRRFSVVMTSLDNNVMGIINAYTAFAEIYVDDIWVDSAYRNQGYGKQLLLSLEEQFKGQGFNNINLCTSAFQAPEFYIKCGFIEEFTRINHKNPKLSKTFFVKFFDEAEETQGILRT